MRREQAVFRDELKPKGRVEIFSSRGVPRLVPGKLLSNRCGVKVYDSCDIRFDEGKLLGKQDLMNIVVNVGKDKVIQSLATGFVNPIVRMVIGDRGTIPSDPSEPKVPDATMTGLYNEVFRDDVEATVINVGTPTVHQIQFIKSFSSLVIPITSFSNQALPVVNEVGIITADLTVSPLPRPPVAAPATPDADEALFAIRTFKSVPFEAANEIAVTIRYTIFIE